MFWHTSRERRGFRSWWHFKGRSCIAVEVSVLRSFCGISFSVNDEGWKFHAAVPGISVWLGLEGFRLLRVDESRECSLKIHDWAIWITPWGRSMAWRRSDPWWVRGITIHVKDLLLGRQQCEREDIQAGIPVSIPMPEGVYPAVANIERMTWKRPLWLRRSRTYVNVEVPNGIPFSGKGENSWDCGDDGLFGYSVEGTSLERAIAHGVESVLSSRRRYGAPSEHAIREALSV